MIELKVHCDCGQKYKFDVEPVNNQMPFTVACPICKRDGTAKANAMLQQMAVFKMVEPPSAPPHPPAGQIRVSVAPRPASPAHVAPPPPAPPPRSAPALRISGSAPAESAGAPEATAPPIAPAIGTAPPPIGTRPRMGMAPAAGVEPGKAPSFGMGLLGGFIGALVGSLIYYAVFKTTGFRLFLAIGSGALAGVGANWLGRGEGSKELGGLTAVFVLVGALAAQYFVELQLWRSTVDELTDAGYQDRVTEAKAVVKAVPTGSDEEIKLYLARQQADPGEVAKPSSITDEEVKDFKEKELPEDRDLASGKLTKDQYLAKAGLDPAKLKKFQGEEGNTFKAFFILWTLNLRSIISMALGAGLAFKLSTNARGE